MLTQKYFIRKRDDLMKMNMDGAVKESRAAGCGGVVRDSGGSWVLGFCQNLGTPCPLMAEVQVIATAVKVVIDRNFPLVVIESDSSEAVRLVSRRCVRIILLLLCFPR